MYKLLLCSRYLRTRYIALASIVSVTLGVATMIVVNSVMSGFQNEMHKRLHGILSDIVVEAHSAEGLADPQILEQEIRHLVGEDLAGLTSTVHIPAMISFQIRGEWITRQVSLIGIDEQTYAQVSDFSQYLLHPENRQQLSFELREEGYDDRLQEAGWGYRRQRVAQQRFYQEQLRKIPAPPPVRWPQGPGAAAEAAAPIDRHPDPSGPPWPVTDASSSPSGLSTADLAADPFADLAEDDPQQTFDPMIQTHVGVVLGMAISNIRHRTPEGDVVDLFLCKPGDDVKATFPTAGVPPEAVSVNLTVVDFYESKMSEYDASFAFVPIQQLQYLRGMIDPQTGMASVSSIQIRLRRGADLNAVRDKLRERFPAEMFPYRIQTWMEMQGPLLSAVQMETTILNILLFLIIAVAGFGILATFFMIVVEKTRDIGVLKSLGASSRGVMMIFLGYGLSLGCVGSGVGMTLGLLFVVQINRIADGLEALTGREVFDPTIYYFQEIPTIIRASTVAWIVVGAMVIAVMASVLPAVRAARMHPVEALRYE